MAEELRPVFRQLSTSCALTGGIPPLAGGPGPSTLAGLALAAGHLSELCLPHAA
jgi:hypothetical protein